MAYKYRTSSGVHEYSYSYEYEFECAKSTAALKPRMADGSFDNSFSSRPLRICKVAGVRGVQIRHMETVFIFFSVRCQI